MHYTKNSHLGWVEEPSHFLLESDHPIGVTCSLNSLNMENEMAMVQLLTFFLPQLYFIVAQPLPSGVHPASCLTVPSAFLSVYSPRPPSLQDAWFSGSRRI